MNSIICADLSFNHITKIEGVSKLTRLVDLSFYNNKLTTIEGLDTLEDLASLSLGNNEIKDLDKVLLQKNKHDPYSMCKSLLRFA
jgi:Leucine-rich repeat (LRR) protein